jgi:hypothetical protein
MTFEIKLESLGPNAPKIEAICRKVSSSKTITLSEQKVLATCLHELGLDPQCEGERAGYLVAIADLDGWFNDQRLADHFDLSDAEIEKISDAQRLKFARDLLRNLGDAVDADIHPGLCLVELRCNETQFCLGYAITGYSFSGVDVRLIAYGNDSAEMMKMLKSDHLLIDDTFFIPDLVEEAVSQIPDELILSSWHRDG